jgi:hypothetical protein
MESLRALAGWMPLLNSSWRLWRRCYQTLWSRGSVSQRDSLLSTLLTNSSIREQTVTLYTNQITLMSLVRIANSAVIERWFSGKSQGSTDPVLYYGTIESGDQAMKNAMTRDNTVQSWAAFCASRWKRLAWRTHFLALWSRQSDYSDSHKNKR